MKHWLTKFILAAASRDGVIDVPSYTDEHIELCAKLYQDNPMIRRCGVLFVTFVAFPDEVMRAVANGMAVPLPEGEEYYPLLDAQRAVRDRLDEEHDRDVRMQIADLERLLEKRRMRISNGAVMEPLHHKAYPRRQQRRIAVEIGAS